MNYPLKEAFEAQKKAYSPYSKFKVGAALKTKSGKIFCGCNIENASYSVTICAERAALASAVSAGEREFESIVIVGGDTFCPPCGICRQALSEFCDEDFEVVLANKNEEIKVFKLKELLPNSFSLEK